MTKINIIDRIQYVFRKVLKKNKYKITLSNFILILANNLQFLKPNYKKTHLKNNKNLKREYDKEKWGVLLRELKKKNNFCFSNIYKFFYKKKKDVILIQNNYIYCQIKEHNLLINNLFLEIIKSLIKKNSYNIIDFGCGFGSTIFFLGNNLKKKTNLKLLLGLDISKSALTICKKISQDLSLKFLSINHNFYKKFTSFKNLKVKTKQKIEWGNLNIGISHFSFSCVTKYKFNIINSIFRDYNLDYLILFELIRYESNFRNNFMKNLHNLYIDNNNYNQDLHIHIKKAILSKKIKCILYEPKLFGHPIKLLSLYILKKNK
jgi:SAM-dependent methyltransferase